MKETIRVKKAFTLIEIIIVIFLIIIVTYLVFSNLNFNTQKKYKVNLENIKSFMLQNFEFENELSLICIEDDALDCYVIIDRNMNRDIKLENLFSEKPEVYNYDKDLSDFSFSEIRLNDIGYEPFFELKINNDRKHKNIVLDTLDKKVYLFSSILKDSEVFESTNEITDRFSDSEIEVKDAL